MCAAKEEGHTKVDRLIAAMERLTVALSGVSSVPCLSSAAVLPVGDGVPIRCRPSAAVLPDPDGWGPDSRPRVMAGAVEGDAGVGARNRLYAGDRVCIGRRANTATTGRSARRCRSPLASSRSK